MIKACESLRGKKLQPGLPMQPTRQFRKLSLQLQTTLASEQLLQAWAPFSLRERCRIIERVFHVRVSLGMLHSFYKAHPMNAYEREKAI